MKQTLRQQALKTRETLPNPEISQAVCEQLAHWEPLQHAKQVLFYYPIRQEVNLLPLPGNFPYKRWYLPCTVGDKLIFREVSQTEPLITGPFGILEPSSQNSTWDSAQPSLIIVPCLMADSAGYRLGYGKGYYDRFQQALPPDLHTTCGVLPHRLLVDELPRDTWDIPLQYLVSEEGVIAAHH